MKTDWKVFVMSVLFASACAAASAVLAEGLEDVDAAWVRAVKAGSLEHVVDLYAPDATLYAPDLMEAKGTEAIRKLYGEMLGSIPAGHPHNLETHQHGTRRQGTCRRRGKQAGCCRGPP